MKGLGVLVIAAISFAVPAYFWGRRVAQRFQGVTAWLLLLPGLVAVALLSSVVLAAAVALLLVGLGDKPFLQQVRNLLLLQLYIGANAPILPILFSVLPGWAGFAFQREDQDANRKRADP